MFSGKTIQHMFNQGSNKTYLMFTDGMEFLIESDYDFGLEECVVSYFLYDPVSKRWSEVHKENLK